MLGLFRNRHASTELSVARPVESLAEFIRRESIPTGDMRKRIKLARACANNQYTHGLHPDWMEAFLEAGFCWVVKTSFAEQFPYAASVYGNCVWSGRRGLEYAGDMPDFAIARLELAKNLCRWTRVSIHSYEPMPVTLRKYDPVMIAWPSGGQFFVEGKKGGFQSTYTDHPPAGFVVAVWGSDHENLLSGR